MTNTSEAKRLVDLDLNPNEASGLLRVGDDSVLQHFGWDRGFWAVLDEVDAAECVVLLGHAGGEEPNKGWTAHRLKGTRDGTDEKVWDAEAIAAWQGWVYVFGSHHGGKEGPIFREVQWVARFEESSVVRDDAAGVPGVQMTVAHTSFRLHRLINDVLAGSGIDLLEMTDGMRAAFVDAAVENLRGTPDEGLILGDDWTINIEGADFTPDGSLLLGLRFPTTADGRPLVVQLDRWEGLFDDPMTMPNVTAIWEVDALGRNGTLAGVRDLYVGGGKLHLVTGDLDSAGKGSVIRQDYPGGTETISTHFVTTLSGTAGGRIDAEPVREFEDNPRIEGIAADDAGAFFYVSDEDESISLRATPLLTGDDD
jgi:hypothetical protein